MNKKGFAISTILYGLIFVSIAVFYLLIKIENTRHATSTNYISDVRNQLTDNVRWVKPYTITNLISNGSFEYGFSNWYDERNGSTEYHQVVSGGYHGNYSLRFGNMAGVEMTNQLLPYSSPILNHKYYGTLMFKSSSTFTTSDSRFEWFYNDTTYGRMVFATKNRASNDWIKLSAIQSITDSTYLSNNWKIRNFHVNANEYSYVDSIMIVDLTEAFGMGNEPDLAWCNENINYFDGTMIVYK